MLLEDSEPAPKREVAGAGDVGMGRLLRTRLVRVRPDCKLFTA
jgi:hypothetical protein